MLLGKIGEHADFGKSIKTDGWLGSLWLGSYGSDPLETAQAGHQSYQIKRQLKADILNISCKIYSNFVFFCISDSA